MHDYSGKGGKRVKGGEGTNKLRTPPLKTNKLHP